ncbi:MAG: hypothetical protein GXP25_18945 [Planctomycetes bacterium]|nr:hypothetical protein [Planctomycetota bacterium]
MSMSHQERILKTMRGEPVDRIPIGSPISRSILPPRDPNQKTIWDDDPNYQAVLPLAEEHCDGFARGGGIGFDRGNLQIPRRYMKGESERKGNRVISTIRIDTPKGELRRVAEKEDGIQTTWVTEPLIKDKADVEKILSVPYEFEEPNYQAFFEDRERLGDRGVMEVGVSVPLVSISHMFHFDEFLLWCAAEHDTIKLLMDTLFERIYDRLERVLKEGVGPSFWLGGSEQATPPMMSPDLYDELSIGYDRQLFDLIHKYDGIVHVHCHGKVNGILDKLVGRFPRPRRAAAAGRHHDGGGEEAGGWEDRPHGQHRVLRPRVRHARADRQKGPRRHHPRRQEAHAPLPQRHTHHAHHRPVSRQRHPIHRVGAEVRANGGGGAEVGCGA